MKFFNKFFFVYFLLLVNCSVWADPLLWEVRDPDQNIRAYLFGSIHLGSENLYPLPSDVMDAYALSKFLVVEADVLQSNNKVIDFMAQYGRYSADEKLQRNLGIGLWKQLEQASGSLGVSY